MARKRQSSKSQTATFLTFGAMVLAILGMASVYARVATTHKVDGRDLKAQTQQIYRSQNIIQAKRGAIYDSVGNVLAENASTYTIAAVVKKQTDGDYVKPKQVTHVAKLLKKQLGGKTSFYATTLRDGIKNEQYQVEFSTRGSNLSESDHKALVKLNIKGLTFESHPARLYPNGQFASDLIGYTKTVTDSKTGLDKVEGFIGIEAAFNQKLAGKNGIKQTSLDAADKEATKGTKAVKNGYDIYTTLNMKLQQLLETKMDDLDEHLAPEQALAVVVDTKTGNIVAETQRPTFNATKGFTNSWQNLLVQSAYEPGSVMKGITLAAAIDSGNWDASATYKSGTLKIGSQKVTDWNDGVGWGTISYSDGIALSSNVAMAMTEQKMGATTWRKYINKFKFLKSTKSGLLGEEVGNIQFRYPIEQANTAFGQGIKVTPLQMIQAYTAIAGDGTEIQPHVISKIVDPNTHKIVYSAKRKQVAKPISAKTALATRKQLEAVIYSTKAIGSMYAIPNVRTTGKSGTAQIATSAGYSQAGDNTNEIHSWIGMAPADNPRYMMYIVVKRPQKNTNDISTSMSTVFKSVMQQALKMDASDNKVVVSKSATIKVPVLKGENVTTAKKEIAANNLQVEVLGTGDTVKAQYPAAGTKTLQKQKVFINTGKVITVPNMHGWSKNDVTAWGKLADIKINMTGSGFVYAQSVVATTRLDSGVHEITVEFKTPKK